MTNYSILTGITPSGSGEVHIGNYFGVVEPFIKLAEKADRVYFFIADLHALTTVQKKEELQHNTENVLLSYLSFGFDPKKVLFYRQSDIPLHTELQTILNNVTPLGLIKRAHAYKDKLAKEQDPEAINLGLFNYPVLMAADILLYEPTYVPVGEDQKQHLEITRDIAAYFNNNYGPTFKLPEFYTYQKTTKIVGTDGQRKMSKSLGNYIGLFEDKEVIRKQIMNCYTDPRRLKATDQGQVEGNPIFIYHELINDNKKEVENLKERYRLGRVGDVEVKDKLFKAHQKKFKLCRHRYDQLKNNPKHIKNLLKKGTLKARQVAIQKMNEVREKVGLTNQYSFFAY
jgi:tryptophanyl-tRNA synthetase